MKKRILSLALALALMAAFVPVTPSALAAAGTYNPGDIAIINAISPTTDTAPITRLDFVVGLMSWVKGNTVGHEGNFLFGLTDYAGQSQTFVGQYFMNVEAQLNSGDSDLEVYANLKGWATGGISEGQMITEEGGQEWVVRDSTNEFYSPLNFGKAVYVTQAFVLGISDVQAMNEPITLEKAAIMMTNAVRRIDSFNKGEPFAFDYDFVDSEYSSRGTMVNYGGLDPNMTLSGEQVGFMIQNSIVVNDELLVLIEPVEPINTASTWAKDGITNAIEKGFVPENIQGSYQNTITRAEFCRMAVKWVEYATGKTIDAVLAENGKTRDPNAFTDVTNSDILAAAALGITSGVGNNRFDPGGQFTRQQAATMILNTCKVIGADTDNPPPSGFSDMHLADGWAHGGIDFVRANGIMSGTGDGFNPKGIYSRQEAIVTFNNIEYNELPGR